MKVNVFVEKDIVLMIDNKEKGKQDIVINVGKKF